MCLIAWIRALITTIVLASYSPLVIGHGQPDAERVGHLAISLFIGRRTRVAASQQFNVTNSASAAKVPASGPATPSCEWRRPLGRQWNFAAGANAELPRATLELIPG